MTTALCTEDFSTTTEGSLKLIWFPNQASRMMNFEEVRTTFYPMLRKALSTTNRKFVYNAVEVDDFSQILEIEMWKAFEQYDPTMGLCFSTYLHTKLQKGCRDATYAKYSQKNQCAGTVSFDGAIGNEDFKLADLIADETSETDSLDYRFLVETINKNMSEKEVEIFAMIVDVKNNTVQDYADRHGLTRQAANKRVTNLKKKLRKIIEEEYLYI